MIFHKDKQLTTMQNTGQGQYVPDNRGTTPHSGVQGTKKRHPLYTLLLVILPIVLIYSIIEVAAAA